MEIYRNKLTHLRSKNILDKYNNMLDNTTDINSKNIILHMIKQSLSNETVLVSNTKLSSFDIINIEKHKLMLERAEKLDEKTFALKSFRESTKNIDKSKYNQYINENINDENIKQSLLSIINESIKEEKPIEYMNSKDALKEIQTSMYKREWHKLPDVHKINRIIEFIKKNKCDKNNYNDTINILISKVKERKLNNKIVQYNTKDGIIELIKGLKYDDKTTKYIFSD